MIQRIQSRLQRMRDDEGFTLIELMVVVLIIAILIAIAIPTFLGARSRAQDRAAQSSLRNTVTAAKAIFTDNEDYSEADQSSLTSEEPALTFAQAPANSTGQNNVVVDGDNAIAPEPKSKSFLAAVLAENDNCWIIQDQLDPNVADAGTKWFAIKDVDGACDTADASGTWYATPGEALEAA